MRFSKKSLGEKLLTKTPIHFKVSSLCCGISFELKYEFNNTLHTSILQEKHLIEVIKDLYAAGIETSNTTLTWSLLYMATWPEIQKKVQQQLDEVIGRERMPSYQDRLQQVDLCFDILLLKTQC